MWFYVKIPVESRSFLYKGQNKRRNICNFILQKIPQKNKVYTVMTTSPSPYFSCFSYSFLWLWKCLKHFTGHRGMLQHSHMICHPLPSQRPTQMTAPIARCGNEFSLIPPSNSPLLYEKSDYDHLILKLCHHAPESFVDQLVDDTELVTKICTIHVCVVITTTMSLPQITPYQLADKEFSFHLTGGMGLKVME